MTMELLPRARQADRRWREEKLQLFDLQILADQPLVKFNRQLPMFNWHYPFTQERHTLAEPLLPFARRVPSRRCAIYIHVPFCETICSFCVFRRDRMQSPAAVGAYVDALVQEFRLKNELLGTLKVDVIFVGGGTPSLLAPEQIQLLGRTISDNFDLSELKEFTFKVEAKSATFEKFDAMRGIGVNRISFGTQTFSPKYRNLFTLDASIDQVRETARLASSMFAYTNTDILYGMAGQDEEELYADASAALDLGTTTVDFYPINNLTAPRVMHREIERMGLAYLPATKRVQYRLYIDKFLRSRKYAPINGYGYSAAESGALGLPKFLYQDLVYGYQDDEIIGYGPSAVTQMSGFNLYNRPDRRRYVSELLVHKTLPHDAFGPVTAFERGVVCFPFRGSLHKARVNWERLPDATWIALQEAVEAGLVVEKKDRFELSRVGWLFYVNLMYFLMPEAGKRWITDRIGRLEGDGRRCGDTDLLGLLGATTLG